jgi:hypothetical protein
MVATSVPGLRKPPDWLSHTRLNEVAQGLIAKLPAATCAQFEILQEVVWFRAARFSNLL